MTHRPPPRRYRLLGMMALAALLSAAGCGSRVDGTGSGTSAPARAPGTSVSPAAAGVAGATVTKDVPHASAPFSDDVPAGMTEPAPEGSGEVPIGRGPAPRALPPPTGSAARLPSVPLRPASAPIAPRAPAATLSFPGLMDKKTFFPPDTIGAAGPAHLVSTLNSGFGIFLKVNGLKVAEKTLAQFWDPVIRAGNLPSDPFDPKILFDQHSGRFVTMALAGKLAPPSWILLAVSATGDPNGKWYQWAIDADVDNGVLPTANWADFPGLGLDNGHVYVTANMYGSGPVVFQYGKVWAIRKPQLLAGDNVIVWDEFTDPPGSGFTMQPAHVFGNAAAEYLVHEGYVDNSTVPPRRALRISSISDNGTNLAWNDLGFIEVASYPIDPVPDAIQRGSAARIHTGDTRMLNAVLRNGKLWATHHVADTDNGSRVEVAWYQIDPADAGFLAPFASPTRQGRIRDSVFSYYYPSIAVNAREDVAIGFSGSSGAEYVGAFYTGRAAGDADNTMQPVTLLKAGETSYFKLDGIGRVRWGDYSGTCVDPANDLLFWTVQEYAASPADTWGTWWGAVAFSPVPPLPSPLGDGGFFGGAESSGSEGCSVSAGRPHAGGAAEGAATVGALLLPAAALALRRRVVRRPEARKRFPSANGR